jgi:periplasmic divalent cation tolerance protein
VDKALCQLWLTCASMEEGDKIGRALLEKRLIACVKKVPVSAEYWWQGEIEKADEVLLVMDSREDLFEQIETEIAKLHSYDTFVLECIPIQRASLKAMKWLEDGLNG